MILYREELYLPPRVFQPPTGMQGTIAFEMEHIFSFHIFSSPHYILDSLHTVLSLIRSVLIFKIKWGN